MYKKNIKRRRNYKENEIKANKNLVTDLFAAYLKKGIIFSLCLLLILVFSTSAFAKDKSVFNIDMYYGWGGYFRPMEWTPVEITTNNSLEKPLSCELTLSSQQDGLNTLNIMIHNLVLNPGATEYRPLVTKIAFNNQRCSLKLDQVDGRRRKTLWSQDYDILMSPGKIPALNEYEMLIGLVGAGKFGILGLEKQSVSHYKGIQGNVHIGNKQASMVPWDWTGFVSLDLLILYNPDWIQLNETQLKAIGDWVLNGGKLLLVTGSRPPLGENPLTNIIPFDYLDAKQVAIPPEQLYKWDLSNDNSEKVTLRPLVPKPNAKFVNGDLYQNNQYLFAVGNAGFGKVGVLGFDPEEFNSYQDINSSRFWAKLIQSVLKTEGSVDNTILAERKIEYVKDTSANIDRNGNPVYISGGKAIRSVNQNYFEIGSAYSLNNKVMEFLYQEIKPLSVWFVILLLGALAILLGPVDYKFLKHIDRLPLTWLTCSFWIILFTVGAYYGVQYVRGGKMQLRVVSVIDGIKDEKAAWSTQYSGLFASKSDSYELDNLKPNEWWSGIAPTQGQIYSFSNELGGRRIYCIQEDGGNLPESLPVNIWDIQCMLTEAPLDKMPLSADIQRQGDEIIATIKNESDAVIINGYILTEKGRGIRFDSIPAHDVKEFRLRIQPLGFWENNIRDFTAISQYSGMSSTSFRNEAAFFAQGTLQRTQAMNNYLNEGASIVCVTYENAPVSFKIKKHSFSEEHIQMARLVVFPN